MNKIIVASTRILNSELKNRFYNSQLCLRTKLNSFPVTYHGFHTSSLFFKTEEAKPPEKKEIAIPEDNIVQKLYRKVFSGVPKSKLKASGYILLTYCAQKQNLEDFFRVFGMPDTFYSWFLVTELHVWMLSCRLMEEGDYGRQTRNAIVEALWLDCDLRAKSIGDMPASMRSKQITSISEEFQAALFVYDEGLLAGDKELANALWRRFFLSMRDNEENQTPDMEKIALLVKYVRATMLKLDNTEGFELIIRAQVDWLPLEETL